MTPLSRLQWSKNGLTGYDANGFAFKLEDPRDIAFMTDLILAGLVKVRAELEKRKTFHVKPEVEGVPV